MALGEQQTEIYNEITMHKTIEHFFKRWAPNDNVALRVAFEADFLHIVQRIYKNAQEPFIKGYSEAMAKQVNPIIIYSSDAFNDK